MIARSKGHHSAAVSARRRVFVRPPTADDRREFLEFTRASRRLHGSWVQGPTDARAFSNYLRRLDGERYVGFLVCLRETGAIVGCINVSEIIRGRLRSAFLGYSGNIAYAGRGLMTEGLRMVVAHAFTKLKLHRLEANIQPGNLASKALARRCGFQKEGFSPRYLKIGGRWRDHERWGLTVEDWRQTRLRGDPHKT